MVFVLSEMTNAQLISEAHSLAWEKLYEHRTDFNAVKSSLLAILWELKHRTETPNVTDKRGLELLRIEKAAEICYTRGEITIDDFIKIKKKSGEFDEIETLWLDGTFNGCLLKIYSKKFPTTANKIQIKLLNQGIDALQGRIGGE